jgi:prepilin-type N-terminal cleavage/methylation domain-containing protein
MIDRTNPTMTVPRARDRGFTLVELMIVVAIIAVVTSLAATVFDEDDETVDGAAGQITSELDNARYRAMADHHWQRLVVTGTTLSIQEGNSVGMVPPTLWTQTYATDVSSVVQIVAIGPTSAYDPTGSAPTVGTGLSTGVTFSPDGSSVARTIYLTDRENKSPERVVVFPTTGVVLTRQGW